MTMPRFRLSHEQARSLGTSGIPLVEGAWLSHGPMAQRGESATRATSTVPSKVLRHLRTQGPGAPKASEGTIGPGPFSRAL